jgi:hypothetical protein
LAHRQADRLDGLLETYDTAIAELEAMDDNGVACLLGSLRVLRDRAAERGRLAEDPIAGRWDTGRHRAA